MQNYFRKNHTMNFQKKIKYIYLFIFSVLLLPQFSTAGIIILNGLTHENEAQPGEVYKGTIQIQNTEEKKKDVRVYIRDYWYSYDGTSKHDPAGTLKRSNGKWIALNPELLTLQPGEISAIDYEVRIPGTDSLKGTYWSVIMVEGITPPDTTNYSSGVTISTAVRYAIQIVTNIGNTGNQDLEFLGLQLDTTYSEKLLNVIIQNTGERLLKPELSIELFDESGNSSGVIKADRRKTYPGTSITITLNLKAIKPGNYTGVLVADCDEDHIFGTNMTIEI
jgi:hypothetical protein